MDKVLRNIFRINIENSFGFDFQSFVQELFLLRYGVTGFTPLRLQKDKGCDGIIKSSKTVIACYGPKDYDPKDFIKKAHDDYKSYIDNWGKKYPNWLFVVNHRLAPEEITQIDNLHKGSLPLGLDQLMAIIENEFDSYKRRKIAQHLNIDTKQYFTQEYLSEILEDLLIGTTIDPNTQLTYKKLIEYPDKIKLNYKVEDVNAALAEFETVIEEFTKIDSLIKNYETDEQERIKLRIQTDFKNANGTFKKRLKIMIENYLSLYANKKDDDYRHFITAVLLYHFEQCIIGNKIKTE